MPWHHVYAPAAHILHVHVSGTVDRDAWERQLRSSLQEAARHSCWRFLVDYRRAAVRLGFLDLYDRPAFFEEAGMPRNARIALLFAPGTPDTEFIETVTANRGYAVKVFPSPEEARAWLTGA